MPDNKWTCPNCGYMQRKRPRHACPECDADPEHAEWLHAALNVLRDARDYLEGGVQPSMPGAVLLKNEIDDVLARRIEKGVGFRLQGDNNAPEA